MHSVLTLLSLCSIKRLQRDRQSKLIKNLLFQQEQTEQFPKKRNNCPLHCNSELPEQHVSPKYVSRRDDSNSTSPSLGEFISIFF